MKYLSICILFYLLPYSLTAQIDAESLMLIPSVTDNSEMNGVVNPNEGAFLYNLSDKNMYYYNGTVWSPFSTSSSNFYDNDGILSGSRTIDGGNNNLIFNRINSYQLFTNNAIQIFPTGALQIGSTGNITQISGATGLSLTATTNGITLNSSTILNNNLSVTGSYSDSNGNAGASGQILTSTGSGTEWKNNYSATVENKTNNYTLTIDDNGKVLTFDSTSNLTLTVPNGLPIGFNISIYQINTGSVTVAGSGSTILNRLSRFTTAGQNAGAGLVSTSSNNFHLTGDLKR